MICKKCGKSNAPIKKCCTSCGSFLVGMTINNVTGEYGYRGGDGLFYKSEEEYNDKKNEPKVKRDSTPKCSKCNSLMEFKSFEIFRGGGCTFHFECLECLDKE